MNRIVGLVHGETPGGSSARSIAGRLAWRIPPRTRPSGTLSRRKRVIFVGLWPSERDHPGRNEETGGERTPGQQLLAPRLSHEEQATERDRIISAMASQGVSPIIFRPRPSGGI